MGVRGLTTYIYNNSKKYFDRYKLHDSAIVIDGNCLASVLFYNSITNTAAFGGDYDRYAKAIENFFNELLKCNVKPYVIFDGGYEKKKLITVCNRNREKVLCLNNVGPSSHSKICFPLMMRQVFRDKLKEMNIPFAQSDLEADGEIAALGRKLNCPVLSNDSDFFIFDVSLIPINEFSLKADVDEDGYYYMSCLIYRVEMFLNSLGGLPKSHLPLLAALLGNDYISRETFANFYSQMKITRGMKLSQIHHRVQAVISWLKRETFDSALKKILGHLKKNRQKVIATKIAKIIQGYSQLTTPLDTYLINEKVLYDDIEIISVKDILHQYDNIDEEDNPSFENDSTSVSDHISENEYNSSSCDETNLNDTTEDSVIADTQINRNAEISRMSLPINPNIPYWLVDYSRSGALHSCILTFYSLKTYFCNPQVEDYDLNHAGDIGLQILSKIAGILLGDDTYSYYCRIKKSKYACTKKQTITSHGKKRFPSIMILNNLNPSQKKTLFFDIFEFDNEVVQVINNFPQQWHLILYSFVYWSNNLKEIHFQSYYLHAVTVMIICIRVIESRIGYFRNKRPFMQKYASALKKTSSSSTEEQINGSETIEELIAKLPLQECLKAFEICLPHFQTEERLKTNSKLFSRTTIHAFAQFQVCIELAYLLNSLFMKPLNFLPINNFFNSTLLYNLCTLFKKRTNVTAYIEQLFIGCPAILNLYKIMVGHLNRLVVVSEKPEVTKKRRKKKKTNKQCHELSPDVQSEKDSSYSDEDNAFSILSKKAI